MNGLPTEPEPGSSPQFTGPGRPDGIPAARADSQRGTMHLVLPGVGEARRESRRVTAALGLLLAFSFLMLNVATYHNARSHLVSERWAQLVAATEAKRGALRGTLDELSREAEFVANQSELTSWPGGARGAHQAGPFEGELDRAASSLDLLAIELRDPQGARLAHSSRIAIEPTEAGQALARRVASTGRVGFVTQYSRVAAQPIIAVAVPIRHGSRLRGSVAVLYASLEPRLRALLGAWVFSGNGAGVFLAIRDGQEAMVATRPPEGSGLSLGQRLPLARSRGDAVAMGAQGVESQVELKGPRGTATWAVVRDIPELGCGLVGQVSREAMLAGLRNTLIGLIVLDLGVSALVLLLVGLWRRHDRARSAEREVRLTREHAGRIQAVLDSAFDAILSLGPDGRVVTVNQAAERLLKRPAAELKGQPVTGLLRFGGKGAEADGSPEPSAVSRGEAIRPDGATVPVEYSLARSSEGRVSLTTLVVRDVGARVQAERQLDAFAKGLEISNRRLEEANHQLEQSSRLKSEFLANTSHELRTPLNGIMGFLQLVLDGMCDSREEERDFLVQALQCSKHLLGLINDVLDIAKIEAGRLTLAVEAIDIGPLFDEVYTVTHVQAQQRSLRLTFEPPPAGTPAVRGDFGKVKQVLINLVGNSLKFTEHGSIVVRVSPQLDAGHVLFEVVDTGIGIAHDRQKLIFEKFTQGDGSATRRYGGTGLGLTITRSLVELMGGVISVESPGVGQGTRMVFGLPVWRGLDDLPAPSESGEAVLPDLISGPAGGALVLIVDDDPVFRRFAAALLQQHGYRTAEASHAEAGWVLVRRLRPALVMLDHALSCPEGSLLRTGWDLAGRMGSDSRTRHIPFVFVTGFDAQLRERLGGVAFTRQPRHLTKPVDASALLGGISDALGEAPGRVVRVLLADDDPTVAAYVCKVLPADRFQVEVVNDGEQCLHFLRTQPRGFDLLLLDLMMPDVSGYDVLREMALTGTAAGLPVIVLTNYPEPRNEAERRLLEQGLVLELLPKTSIHEQPTLLPQAIDRHLEALEGTRDVEGPKLEVERFRAELPEGDISEAIAGLGVERFSGLPTEGERGAAEPERADSDDPEDERRVA